MRAPFWRPSLPILGQNFVHILSTEFIAPLKMFQVSASNVHLTKNNTLKRRSLVSPVVGTQSRLKHCREAEARRFNERSSPPAALIPGLWQASKILASPLLLMARGSSRGSAPSIPSGRIVQKGTGATREPRSSNVSNCLKANSAHK